MHGTYRQKDRVYREEFFYGQGKSLDEVTESELAEDMAERKSENPLAYENNRYAYELKKSDIVKKRNSSSTKTKWTFFFFSILCVSFQKINKILNSKTNARANNYTNELTDGAGNPAIKQKEIYFYIFPYM